MTDERLPKSFALGMATSTRGACHMRSHPSLDILGLSEEVLKKIYGGPVSNRFLRKEFNKILDEYYQLHGWDENGVPKRNTLKRLGIGG